MRFPGLVAAAALFLAFPASSQDNVETGSQVTVDTTSPVWPASPRDFVSTEQLLAVAASFPNSAGMQRRRLGAALQAGDAAAARDALRRLAIMGAVLTPASQAQVASLVGAETMASVAARMAENAAPRLASSRFATIPVDFPLIEGVIWDGAARRLYATAVVGRALLRVDRRRVRQVAGGFGSLLGGAWDPAGRRLWIASAELEPTPRDRPNFVGLVSIDPANPADVRRLAAPEGATPGDVAIAQDGTVYASDGLNGALYRCRPGCAALDVAFPPGVLLSAQGLALSPDQRLLYIADRRYGIAALDRATGRLLQVRADEGIMLDGIDGLVIHDGALIATQTAYPPSRIVRLRLSPDGLRVTALELLERANPEWGEVTLMTVAGDRLLYVAGAQWDHYGAGGASVAGNPPGPTPIRSLSLR